MIQVAGNSTETKPKEPAANVPEHKQPKVLNLERRQDWISSEGMHA